MSHEGKPPGDYEVGYGKPPTHTRFKAGQSGNPKGRKKGMRNVKSILEEELFRPVSIIERGKRRNRPLLTVGIRQAGGKMAQGDLKALIALIPLLQRTGLLGNDEPVEAAPQRSLSPDEAALLRETLAEMKAERDSADAEAPR